MSLHNCELLESWRMDERAPVELRRETGKFVLTINSATAVTMAYCPWCGKSLDGSGKPNPLKAAACEHMKDLAAMPESSIRYLSAEREYCLCGANGLSARLFFCPKCGRKLPVHQTNRYEKSPREVARLRKLFANVRSVDEAIEQVGQPDFERGPNTDHFYWNGARISVGFKRALFYERFARTVEVHVVEWADGKTEVKFLAKAPTVPHKR
jgi:hypothetical protein